MATLTGKFNAQLHLEVGRREEGRNVSRLHLSEKRGGVRKSSEGIAQEEKTTIIPPEEESFILARGRNGNHTGGEGRGFPQ